MTAYLEFVSNLVDWQPGKSLWQPDQTEIVYFLGTVISKLISSNGHDWQYKFKTYWHVGMSILIKVQIIVSKIVLASGNLDIEEWDFDNGPMELDQGSDLQHLLYLLTYFIKNLSCSIITKTLGVYSVLALLYITLYPITVTNNKRLDRNKSDNNATNTCNTGGSGGSNKSGNDAMKTCPIDTNTTRNKVDKPQTL